jgi:hypothetical protein
MSDAEAEVRVGNVYRIVSGEGAGLVGRAIENKESGFGHKHVLLRTPKGEYWKRWIDVEASDLTLGDVPAVPVHANGAGAEHKPDAA